MTLPELLDAAAAGLDGVTATPSPDGGVSWSKGSAAFAVLGADGASAEFRLDAPVAMAAVRTPDTAPSSRGPGWIWFRPAVLDGHAMDRATAWFVSAHRRSPGA